MAITEWILQKEWERVPEVEYCDVCHWARDMCKCKKKKGGKNETTKK